MADGVLYLVATPIGNLEDVTARAVRVRRPLRSYYDAVEHSRAPALVRELLDGRNIALVSDAGTPGIADPGYRLVERAIAAGIRIVPVPGPSAITAFLPVSGLPTDRFAFEGFLPKRTSERRRRLAALKSDARTLIFYEAGRRLVVTLADMAEAFGPRRAAIGREITKLHEEIVRDDLLALSQRSASLVTKGEVVIGVAGAAESDDSGRPRGDVGADAANGLETEIRRRREAGESVRDLATALARERGLNRRSVYRLVLAVLGGAERER
jgi:16S rRNA (cytidine1402-2'-O)-methyltransferase